MMKKEYNLSKLQKAKPKYLRRLKQPVTVRLDPQVIAYFKQLAKKMGFPYQSLINMVLKEYASMNLTPTANWRG